MRVPVPVVAVGAGRVAHTAHLREIRDLPEEFRLAAVVETDPGRVAAVRRLFPDAAVCSSADQAVRAGARAALCLTPWWTHRQVAEEYLERGLPVLCEKPVSLDPAEIDALIEVERRTGVAVTVGYMKRHDPVVAAFVDRVRRHRGTARRITVEIHDPNAPHQIEHLVPAGLDGVSRYSPAQVAAVERALGGDAGALQREVYARGLGGSLVHQVNIVQDALGPDGPELLGNLLHSAQWAEGTAVTCCWRPTDGLVVEMSHARLPQHRRYRESIEFVAEDAVAVLRMPSPYSRDLGATLDVETWDAAGTSRRGRTTGAPGQTGFRLQLRAWARSLAGESGAPLPGLAQARRDVEILREAALSIT